MDPLTMAAIGMGVSTAGGLIGQLIAGKSREEAERILQSVRDDFGRIDPAKVQRLAMDPQFEGAQRGSLGLMDQQIAQGGMTTVDRAAQNEAMDDVARQDRAQRAHIQNSFAARGASSGGQNLLAQLVNQQGSAERAQSAGLNTAANAQARYWQAVRDRFGMAQRGQEQRSAVDRWNNQMEENRFDRDYRQIQGRAGIAQQQVGRKDDAADGDAEMWARLGEAGAQGVTQYGAQKKKGQP